LGQYAYPASGVYIGDFGFLLLGGFPRQNKPNNTCQRKKLIQVEREEKYLDFGQGLSLKQHDLKRLSFFHPSPERNSYLRHYDIVKFDENFVLVFLVSCTRFLVQNPH